MSLKTFHVIFIACSIILVIGFGCWGIDNFQQKQAFSYLWTGIGSFLLAAGLIIFEYVFLKKNKGVQ